MNGATWVLMVPALAAPLLALLPGYRLSARVNIAASFFTLLAALSLFASPHAGPSPYILVDELNIVSGGGLFSLVLRISGNNLAATLYERLGGPDVNIVPKPR